jgi:hypothetical protein
MSGKNNFLDYIHNPMSRESVEILYGANNIIVEKCELYNDFTQSLLSIVFATYLGDDVTSVKEQIKHFNWCWNKNISNFKEEGLIFNNQNLYNYFMEFLLEVFYTSPDKEIITDLDEVLIKLWNNVFEYDRPKTNSDMDTLIEIYLLFEKSIKTV